MRTTAMLKEARDTFEDVRTADGKGRVALGARFAGRRFAVREQPDGGALLTPVVVTAESERPLTTRRLREAFAALEGLPENWDGHGSAAPAPETVAAAREALALLHAGALARGVPWREPHVSADERGQVTLEWWAGSGAGTRTLTVFVRPGGRVDYLKAWGHDIESEMADGELSRLSDFAALSHWLYGAGGERGGEDDPAGDAGESQRVGEGA